LLLAGGASVPFIARYRKEQTGGLDEVQLRDIEEKSAYQHELHERRRTILAEIEGQKKLTSELRAQIETCTTKTALEDLYLPYKPKRRTRAMIAKERGLEPLALRILEQPGSGNPEAEAKRLIDPARELPDTKTALAGARDIAAEAIAELGEVRAAVRQRFEKTGVMRVGKAASAPAGPTKFETYYEFEEKAVTLPSHRFLAIRRGENEGVLRGKIEIDREAAAVDVARIVRLRKGSPFASLLEEAIAEALARLLCPSLEVDLRMQLKLAADRDAIGVFAENVKKLLLAAPLGRKVVLGIDPGQRTGCKCVIVDDTGKLLTHTLVNLVQGDSALAQAKRTLTQLLSKYKPYAIAIGNGTHGRETADFCRDVVAESSHKEAIVVMVSESGASVYSASDVAREEFPDLDLTVRGAVSIARRLQDPLAELVKVDPKAIGVGQYQHDVNQPMLKRKLDDVVESCVNAVGVELNTASAPLLTHVAGVGPTLAKRIVKHREKQGAFPSRAALLDVPGLGPKAFEQAAGFVRVRGGAHPLDASAVHPERYELARRIARDAGLELASLVGNEAAVKRIPWAKYVSDEVGLPTLEDIQKELLRPGRDPREAFEAPQFRADVRRIEDLSVGMELEGIITNVTAFGAFVDVGVHQDGLVHVSQLADRFVKDPHQVAKVGDRIKVRVLEVDLPRKRIALSAKSRASGDGSARQKVDGRPRGSRPDARQDPRSSADREAPKQHFSNNPFAALLKK
jgi:uncharacterized protein